MTRKVYLDHEVKPNNPLADEWEHICVTRNQFVEEGQMVTNDVYLEIFNEKVYELTYEVDPEISPLSQGLKEVTAENADQPVEDSRIHKDLTTIGNPDRAVLRGDWFIDRDGSDPSNILGNISPFTIYDDSKRQTSYPTKDPQPAIVERPKNGKLKLPIAETTQENLNYYGAILYKLGEKIKFDLNQFEYKMPLTHTSVGKHYIDKYIHSSQAGGVFVEWHRLPHFHMPLYENCSGCLLLGKKFVKDEDRDQFGINYNTSKSDLPFEEQFTKNTSDEYHFSAFKIPYGYGIYTMPFTLHNDCFLIGNYIVAYSFTETYSTVKMLKEDGEMLSVKLRDENLKDEPVRESSLAS